MPGSHHAPQRGLASPIVFAVLLVEARRNHRVSVFPSTNTGVAAAADSSTADSGQQEAVPAADREAEVRNIRQETRTRKPGRGYSLECNVQVAVASG